MLDAEWREVPGFKEYMVSSDGRVYSVVRKRELVQVLGRSGYKEVGLQNKGRRLHTTVHRLMYRAFVSDVSAGWDIHHENGDKLDNRLENLAAIRMEHHRSLHCIDKHKRGVLDGGKFKVGHPSFPRRNGI